MIGYEKVGSGNFKVMVLNDWLCDTSTWDCARNYLDKDSFTWVFADLRGYGRSKGQTGLFTLTEVAADVLNVANALGWQKFVVIGHSMSSLVALHLAQHQPDRIERVVVLAPPPPSGLGADDATLADLKAIALGDDTKRLDSLRAMWGDRLSEGWLQFKVAQWRAYADPEAVAGYTTMFAKDGMPNPTAAISMPLLAITGEQDTEVMRCEAVTHFLSPLCDPLVVVPFADCGHYPMQEAPPRLVAVLEQFLRAASVSL
jgi:pimeloyl-ACP methyl ester carboxylesterase